MLFTEITNDFSQNIKHGFMIGGHTTMIISVTHIHIFLCHVASRGRRDRDGIFSSWIYNYLCNQCISPLNL
jgi:hypothetical protein